MKSISMLATVVSPSLGLGLVLGGLPAVVVAAPLSTAGAHAVVAPDAQEQAQQLYQAGLQHFEAGRFEPAAAAFEEAFALAGDPTLLYNVSIAYEKAGKLELALVALEQYIELAPAAEQPDLERQRKALVVRIDRAKQADEDAAEPATSDTSSTLAQSAPRGDDPTRPRVVTPWVASWMAVTVVATGTGVGLAVPAIQANREVEAKCVDRGGAYLCEGETSPLFDRRRGLAIGADVAFGVAIAAGVAAITLLSINISRARRSQQQGTAMTPMLGPRTAGVGFVRRF